MQHPAQLYRHLIGALWLAWALYWCVAALGSKSTQRRESTGSRLVHLTSLLLGAVLIGWHNMPWPWLARRLWPVSFSSYCIGVVLIAAGLSFSVWARVHLGRNWSGTVTVKQEHELIRSGPYALVRHPIYTGVLVALVGTVMISGTLRAIIGLLLILASLLRKMRIEESFMRETFAGAYERYRDEVPALIPFAKPRRSVPR
jgi:protein-S-isoprenylcysteine O-methyltransferase Ste14